METMVKSTRWSKAYRFTVTDRNDPRLDELRAEVRASNKARKRVHAQALCDYVFGRSEVFPKRFQYDRVVLRARGGKNNAALNEARANGEYGGHYKAGRYPQLLRLEHGVRFDVYVHNW